MHVLYAVPHQFYDLLTGIFLKAPDCCCLEVVLILQSFQIRRAIILNLEHPQRNPRGAYLQEPMPILSRLSPMGPNSFTSRRTQGPTLVFVCCSPKRLT